jgi:integrase
VGVYQRKNGWAFEIRQRVEGKQITLASEYGFPTKDAATLAWIEAKAVAQTRATRTTFSQVVNARMDHLQAYTVREEHEKVSKTYANNRARLRRFAEWWDIPIEEITRDMIQAKMLALLETFTPANVNKHLVCLRAVFNHAINNELGTLTRNPAARVPFFAESEKSKMIPERDQVAQVKLLAQPLDRAYLVCIQYSAARVGEINKLTWEDVNFETGMIRLYTSKKAGGNRKGRWIPVIDKVVDALRYAHQHRTKNSPWVFTNPKMVGIYANEPGRWRWIYRDKFLKTLCREAGVPEMGYHCLRHAAASEMAAKGIPLTDIQKYLGHERATTTDLYLQSLGHNSLRAAANALDDNLCDCATECATANQETQAGG